MDTMERLVYASWVFRALVMLLGLAVIGTGLHLFRQPAQSKNAGSLNAEYQGGKISLRGAAGTFFLVLGTVIVLVGLLRKTGFDWSKSSRPPGGGEVREEFHGFPSVGAPDSADTDSRWRDSLHSQR
jgi:hypothetical protein